MSVVSLRNWGASADEISGPVVGDEVCPDARVVATRCITISAPPADVFAWIRQMGFGRAGWYSYDWIDNLGRKSATSIHAEWQDVHSGSIVPAGPIDFEAVIVDPPRAFVIKVATRGRMGKRMCFTLSYELREDPAGTRLVTRMRARMGVPAGTLLDRFVLAPGDGLMVRKQLLNIARRAGT
jgi:hypothetical protein